MRYQCDPPLNKVTHFPLSVHPEILRVPSQRFLVLLMETNQTPPPHLSGQALNQYDVQLTPIHIFRLLFPRLQAHPYSMRVPTDQKALTALPSGAGRTELLAHLDSRFRLALLAYFGRRVSGSAEAEDLTQDVFERVLRTLDNGPVLNAEALVFRIAVNLLRDRARKAHTHGVEEPIPGDAVAEIADALTVAL